MLIRPRHSHSGRSSWRCCWWWRSTDGRSSIATMWENSRTHGAGYTTGKHFTSSQSFLLSACSVTTLTTHTKENNSSECSLRGHVTHSAVNLKGDRNVNNSSSHFLPSKEVTWKQKRRSSQSTAMTEQLSRSVTSPPATSPRAWCIRLPPCVKKYWRSQDDDTRPVLLRDRQESYVNNFCGCKTSFPTLHQHQIQKL